MFSEDLERQKKVVPSLPLGHHTAAVGPYLSLGYPTVLLGEEVAHRDLSPSKHTLTPHNTRGRSLIIRDVGVTRFGPGALTFFAVRIIVTF